MNCRECDIELDDSNWYSSRKKKHSYICKKCDYNYGLFRLRRMGIKPMKYNTGTCKECGIILNSDNWHPSGKESGNYICILCTKEKNKINGKKYRIKLKDCIIIEYGGKCECCGETRKEFLTIDHINGNGHQHKKEIESQLYLWLKNNNFPTDNFRLLCMNCNFSLGKYGYCPHDKEKS